MGPKDLTKIYSESFGSLSDAEKQAIRRKLLGLEGNEKEVDFDYKNSYLVNILEDSTLGIKGAQQDAFRGLAADLLKTTVDKLKEQKAKEAEFDMLKGLPGFSEIANMGGSISNSILGEIGGAAGMAGIDLGMLGGVGS